MNEPFKKQPLIRINESPRNEPCICGSGKKFKHCCWDGKRLYATQAKIDKVRAQMRASRG